MIKILFGINSLHIGGIQTALINLLQELDYSKYEVTLQLFHYEEEYLDCLPTNVKVRNAPYLVSLANNTMIEARKKGFIHYILRGVMAVLCKVIGANRFYSLILSGMEDNNIYDEAVSFTNNGDIKTLYFGMNQYILNHVKAKHKSTWLHVDFESMRMNSEYNISEYRKFDRVITVSEAAKEVFLQYVPDMRSKTFVVYNVIDRDVIRKKGSVIPEHDNFKKSRGLNLVTICRLDQNKNVIACLDVAQKLKDLHVMFHWIVVGDGTERAYIAKQLEERNLEEYVFLVGYQRNPYPYIINSDIAVSTSLSESYGMSIAEAIVLHTPAVSFFYPALPEVIEDRKNGIIVNRGDIDGMVSVIKELYDNRMLLTALKENCHSIITVEDAIRQFDSIFHGDDE